MLACESENVDSNLTFHIFIIVYKSCFKCLNPVLKVLGNINNTSQIESYLGFIPVEARDQKASFSFQVTRGAPVPSYQSSKRRASREENSHGNIYGSMEICQQFRKHQGNALTAEWVLVTLCVKYFIIAHL